MTKIIYKTSDSITDEAFNILLGEHIQPRQHGRIIVEQRKISVYNSRCKNPIVVYDVDGYNTERFTVTRTITPPPYWNKAQREMAGTPKTIIEVEE